MRESKRARVPQQPQNPLPDLPEDVLRNVFSFLPMREAIEASTVSTRFKNSWLLNRKFMFGKDYAVLFSREDLVQLVDRLFDSHEGDKIQAFQLHMDPNGVEELIKKWLRISIQKGVEELELYFLQPGYTLDVDFVNDLKELRSLKLVHCDMVLPPVLKSMQFLNSLVLWQVQFTEEKLETLFKYCKLLSSLDMFHCSGIFEAKINAGDLKHFKVLKIASCPELIKIVVESPTIRSIFYSGFIPKFRFFETVQLHEAFFNFEPVGSRSYLPSPLVNYIVNDIQHHVKVLTTSALFPEALSAKYRCGSFKEANYSFINLTELQLFMNGGLFCNPYDIVMLIKHSPVLEKLFIDMNDYNFQYGMYWDLHQKPELDKLNHNFDRLKVIRLNGFRFQDGELQLVKVLLERSIILDTLILVTPKNGRSKLCGEDAPKYKSLFLSWKASPKAKIVLFEHFHDRSSSRPSHPKCWY